MSGPHTGLNSTCRKAGGILEVLPESLSTKARQEINKACSELARKAKDKTEDLEHVARGELGKVSKETQKELAELARDLGQKHSHTPAATPGGGSTPGIKDVASLTKGKGERLKVAVPVKFTNATDVYLFLNYDKRALMRFDPKLYGGGAGVTHALSPDAKLKAEVAVDASQRQVQTAGFIKLELAW